MSLSYLARRLNKAIIYPLIVKPLRDCIEDLKSDNRQQHAITMRVLLNAINDHVDKSSKYIPLVLVQDLGTGLTLKGDLKAMQLRDDQKCRIEFGKPVDKKGQPASVQEGSVSVSITDDSAHFEPDPDNPFAGTVIADKPTADPTAPGAIVITADADMGEGVRNIQGVEPLIVTGGEAVGFGAASLGTPEDQ